MPLLSSGEIVQKVSQSSVLKLRCAQKKVYKKLRVGTESVCQMYGVEFQQLVYSVAASEETPDSIEEVIWHRTDNARQIAVSANSDYSRPSSKNMRTVANDVSALMDLWKHVHIFSKAPV